MKVMRTIPTAVRALRRNVGRALLTMLGIVIGIAAVIAMMEIGHGAQQMMEKSISSMGSNNLLIFPGNFTFGGVNSSAGRVTLTADDCDAIIRECPAVRVAAPSVRAGGQVVYGSRNYSPNQIVGTTPEYLDVRDYKTMAEGEAFTNRDVRGAALVCLIGQTIKKQLFPDESAVGKVIRISNVPFKVLGVLISKGASVVGQDQDDVIIAPWVSIRTRLSNRSAASSSGGGATSSAVNSISALFPTLAVALYPEADPIQQADTPLPVRFNNIDQIMLSARSPASIQAAITQVTQVLRERHHLGLDQPDDFTIRDMTELSKTLTSTSALMTNLLLFVALISLVVGGVGIMNIMLVSVTERTREIGLRMAVGARSLDILVQFLVESIILCLSGGVIGICLGRSISMLIAYQLHWPVAVSVNAIVLSTAVAGIVGVVFGFYPAMRAANLDPIEALRYE